MPRKLYKGFGMILVTKKISIAMKTKLSHMSWPVKTKLVSLKMHLAQGAGSWGLAVKGLKDHS